MLRAGGEGGALCTFGVTPSIVHALCPSPEAELSPGQGSCLGQGSPAPSQGLLSSGLGQELWDPVMECKYDGGSGEGLNSVCVCTLQNAPVTGVIYYRGLTVQSTHKHQG